MSRFTRKRNNNRYNKKLFNPYLNGIASYDLAYLSSGITNKTKEIFVNQVISND